MEPPQVDFPSLVVPATTKINKEWMDGVVLNKIFAESRGYLSKEDNSRISNHCVNENCITTADLLSACTVADTSRLEYQSAMDQDRSDPASPLYCTAETKPKALLEFSCQLQCELVIY